MPDNTPTLELLSLRTGRNMPEYLRELSIARRLTDQEIATLLGVSRTTIVDWRRRFGINRAERKAAVTGEAVA